MDYLLDTNTETKNNKYDFAGKIGEGGSGMLIGVDLKHHYALKTHIGQFTIADSTFTSFNSMDTVYEACRWLDTSFVDSDFIYTKFQNCYFRNLNFEGCTFRYTAFEGCTFDNCNFASIQPISDNDEVAFKSCVILDGENGFGEMFANKAVMFSKSLLDSTAAPRYLGEIGDNLVRMKAVEVSRMVGGIGVAKSTEKEKVGSPVKATAPATKAVAAGATGGINTRFDRLEF